MYAASARTLSGSLAEMERIIGDALFAGYVGYNGRAPGSTAAKKEDSADAGERNKSGGDARHTLVAYFEIMELASILCVDRETANLAIRTFRHTANNTSLRNRNVESLATAAFVSAAERRWHEYQEWLKQENGTGDSQEAGATDEDGNSPTTSTKQKWLTPPRRLTVEEISAAANLDRSEVLRYLKVVNVALRKQRPQNNSSITTHMPTFCKRLDLPESTRKLAIALAENAMQNNVCSRRNQGSISAAAIYLACQLEEIRKTQAEICRATTVTEVTLRKVHKELLSERDSIIPDWYVPVEKKEEDDSGEGDGPSSRHTSRPSSQEEAKSDTADASRSGTLADPTIAKKELSISLQPPPLPPGFQEKLAAGKGEKEEAKATPVSPQVPQQPANPNAMLAMLNNPAMQAFANAFSMMPRMMPPPPPPLPIPQPHGQAAPSNNPASKKQLESKTPGESTNPKADGAIGEKEEGSQNELPPNSGAAAPPMASMPTIPPPIPPIPSASSAGPSMATPIQPAVSGNLMAGMQSVMGMVQAVQAFQVLQQRQASSSQVSGSGTEHMNPLAMMAMAMAQAQNMGNSNPGLTPKPSVPEPKTAASTGTPVDQGNASENGTTKKNDLGSFSGR